MRPWLCLALAAGLLMPGCGGGDTASRAPSPIQFRDVTEEVGIRWSRVNGAFGARWLPETMGGGGAFLDYDQDGWLDILLLNGDYWPGHRPARAARPTMALYRNREGRYEQVTTVTGLDQSFHAMGACAGDYDNDGYPDLLIAAVDRARLFHNRPGPDGKRRFEEVTTASGLVHRGWSTAAAWLDYDRDGLLDLFIAHYVRWSPAQEKRCGSVVRAYCRPQEYQPDTCRLYRNLGRGRFEDVTRSAGILNGGAKALGVAVADLDGSGAPSLIVANDTEPNFVYRNNGDGTFTEVGSELGVAVDDSGKARAGMGLDLANYRGAGTEGLAIGNFSFEGIAFYDLSAPPPYDEQAKRAGLFNPSYPYITFGLFFSDLDNDGHMDLFAANGHVEDTVEVTNPGQSYAQPALLFRNTGDGRFTEVGEHAGACVREPLVGRAACRGDFDNDGRVDVLLVPNTGRPRLLRNETRGGNRWLALRLQGTRSNRDGLGARVEVRAGNWTRTLYSRSGSSYLSSHDPRLHVGLGSHSHADAVTVRWPSGLRETWSNLEAGRLHTLVEQTGARLPQASIRVPSTSRNRASHSGCAGQAGAVTRCPST